MPPGGRGLRPDDQVDRTLPARGRGTVPSPRRRAGTDGRNRNRQQCRGRKSIMTTTTKRETAIYADPSLPTVRISREFDATPDKVFRAWAEPELFAQWIGPRGIGMRIEKYDARTGGSYRYVHSDDDGEYGFYGSFHE